ncbi:ribosome silencing factor [Gynuella sp.]|uniref:ribosome silencing factor n=1 Tax=Gynuella sp. TaxID=2969146 RepID=UPI003D0B7E1D
MSSQKALKEVVLEALDDIKAQDVVALDVADKTSITDLMVIASGTSSRHLQAIVDNVSEDAKAHGYMTIGREGDPGSEWVLIDFGDLVLHVMLPATRAYYDLERLWEGPAAVNRNSSPE